MLIKNSRIILSAVLLLVAVYQRVQAQDISVQLGKDEIALNELFTITITVTNGSIKSYTDFPEIDGFAKRGTSSSSRTNIVNGQITSTQSIIQRYLPLEKGTYTLNAFSIDVNGTTVESGGKRITVVDAIDRPQSSRRRRYDPFDDLFGERRDPEFVDVKEDAFLALTTDKDEVFVGEGFTTTFAFYVADANRAPLQFHDAGKQLSEILKKIRPENCWEENYNIENIYGERVQINGKTYTRYKIYQATYYPLNVEPVEFPSVPFEMIKYRVAKSPSFFGRDRQEDFKTFYSSRKTVKVKPLPPHPMKDMVAVGDFELDEKIDRTTLETGQSFQYEFNIIGEGNIAGIADPVVPSEKNVDIFPPNITQDINRGGGRVTGSKNYSYFGIPNEPGEYALEDYFSWVYFDPEREVYDTLQATVDLNVIGESKKNVSISSTDLGSFYDNIDTTDNELRNLAKNNTPLVLANILLIAMLVAAGLYYFKK